MNILYDTEKGSLVEGNCFEVFNEMQRTGRTADLIISDIPYNVTRAKWEKDFDRVHFLQRSLDVIAQRRAVIVFCNKPTNGELVYKFPKQYRHDIIWEKEQNANPFMTKFMPARVHEEILVFGNQSVLYNPQKEPIDKPRRKTGGRKFSTLFESNVDKAYRDYDEWVYDRFPISIRRVKKDSKAIRFHPTQKPVELLEFLVKSYSNFGDTVWDFTAGSCSLAVACMNTGRRFYCVEKDGTYIQHFMDMYAERLKVV